MDEQSKLKQFNIGNVSEALLQRIAIEAGYQRTSAAEIARKAIEHYLTLREAKRNGQNQMPSNT